MVRHYAFSIDIYYIHALSNNIYYLNIQLCFIREHIQLILKSNV